ncbi:MAG: zeta toxin family protein [Elusimicrobiaceae bacterium]|nr:zeta toxin family protein [Elusimicrobiaceae bacterium]
MNRFERGVMDMYTSLELGGLGDLKAAVKDSKSLFTTKDGLKTTVASAGTFGLGTSPATAMSLRPQFRVKANVENIGFTGKASKPVSTIFDMPINLFDPMETVGSSGRAVSHFPNSFKITTPKINTGLFNRFKLFPNYMGLVRQQKLNNLVQTSTFGGITTVGGLMALGTINPITAAAMTGLLIAGNAVSMQAINNNLFKGKKSNARSDTSSDNKNNLTLDQVRLLNIAKKAPLFAVMYSFMTTGLGDFVSPAVALAQDTFNITPFEASLLSLSGYLMFLFSVPISNLQTKIGKANVMKIGTALATAGAALPMFFGMYGNYNPQTANINQFYAMAVSIAMVCLGATMLETGASSLFADVSKSNKDITPNLVLADAIRCIPMALGFVAPAVLSSIGLDWTALYPIYTAIFASALGIISKTKIAEVKHESTPIKSTVKLLKNKDITLLVAAAFAYIGAEIPLLSMTPIMFAEQGFSVEKAEIMGFLTTMLPIIISNFISPPLIKRFGEDKVLITSLITALAGLSLVFTPAEATKYIGLVLAGLGYGNIWPLLLGKAQQKDLNHVDGIMGLMLTATVGAAFMTPLAAGFASLTNTTLSYLIPVACASFILGVVLREIKNTQGEPKITIEYLEAKYGHLIYPNKVQKKDIPQAEKEEQPVVMPETIPLQQQAKDWGMPETMDRSILESIAWTLGIPQRRIFEVSTYGLWLLVCLYSWMQLGKPITTVRDENLVAMSKEQTNILKMFPEGSTRPEFAYVYSDDNDSFQVISLDENGVGPTVGGFIDAPLEAPWDNVEYIENVVIAGKSIPVFKISNPLKQDLKISEDVDLNSPIIKYAAQYDDPNVTVEQILNDPIFHPYHATDGNIYNYSAILQMIRKSERNLSSTSDEFRAFGEKEKAIYRPERQELHDQIIDKIFGDYESKVSEHPTFILLGGRGGSGKSKFEGKVYDTKHYLLLDSDAIKAMLPEYEGYNSHALHNESRDLLDRILRLSIEKKVNVVLDATMSSFGTLKNRLQMFKDAGYRTEAHYMFVPRQETGKRALMRFLNNPDGRYVPIQVALNMRNNEKNFDAIKYFVDGWTFNDNNVPYGAPPKLIAKHGIFSYGNAGKTWEEVSSSNIVEQKNSNKLLPKLSGWVLPAAVGIGLLAFSLANPSTAPIALAAVPLLANTQPLGPDQTDNDAISAKVLFTDEYKNKNVYFHYRDIEEIIASLPPDFEEENAIYRGMTLKNYKDLMRLFTTGLLVDKSGYNYIHFSRRIEDTIDYSTEYEYGHLPVLIKMYSDYKMLAPIVKYAKNIPAKDIAEVLVWAELDGKLGWWKAVSVDGKIVLRPTENMRTVETPAVSATSGEKLSSNQNKNIGQKEEKPAPEIINNQSSFKLPSWVLPAAVGVGLLAFSLLNSATASIALAAIPIIGGVMPSKEAIEQDAKIQKFVNLRKNFDKTLFEGDELISDKKHEEFDEVGNLKRILGEDFFNLWQKYYNKDLKEMANKNPQDLFELAKYSKRYESTLPSEIGTRFKGTNPLYVFTMKYITEAFEQDLLSGKSMKEAVTNMGQKMFEYHKKINQIKKFFELKRNVRLGKDRAVWWYEIENLKDYNKEGIEKLKNGLTHSYKIGFGILPEGSTLSASFLNPNDTEYWQELIDPNNKHFTTYKGVELSEVQTKGYYPLIISAMVNHPVGANNINKMFEVLQDDYNNIRPIISLAQNGEELTPEDIKTLDENIAEISYLFTNAKPFYRGSASANLAIVYGLYHMAGIEAPQVKMGRELDWSAFAMSPFDYTDNWLDLFDGEFKIISKEKSTPAEKPLNLKTDIAKAEPVNQYVSKLMDSSGNTKAYYKKTSQEEINRAWFLEEIVEDNNFQDKYPLIKLEYPKVLSRNLSDLPNDIAMNIKFAHKHSSLDKDMIMSAVITHRYGDDLARLNALQGKPITNEEWAQVVSLFEDLHDVGFYHTDLGGNIFFRRDDEDKLIITLIDFENWGASDDMEILESIKDRLERIGAKEKLTPETANNQSSFKLPSWVLPTVGIGMLAAILSNTVTAPLALAALPLIGNIKMPTAQSESEIEKYVDLRGEFNQLYFSGDPLTRNEAKHMREILGSDFFDLWQTFYNKDLSKMFAENPELIKELAYYSNRYETTLPSQEKTYPGTNPLFLVTMRDLTNNFINDLNSGKTVEQATTELGNAMFDYQKKRYQIKSFLYFRKFFKSEKDSWDIIKNPPIYNISFDGTEDFAKAHHVGFGKFNNRGAKKDTTVTLTIKNDVYSEYIDDFMVNNKRPDNYKGVDLAYRYVAIPNHVEIAYPNLIQEDGSNNNTRAFNALQEDWKVLKPLVNKYNKGITLTKKDISLIHNTVADMSYIFTNAVPFHKGSASANLAMVYGIYQMFGINAPQVKKGRALDLSAFATTPEQYKENWLNLFDDDFEIISAENHSSNQNASAEQETYTPAITPVALSGESIVTVGSTAESGDLIDVNTPYALRKSVFRLAGFDNSFSGFLGVLPSWITPLEQGIFTAGHGVSRFPDKPVTVFNHLGKRLTEADVLLFKHDEDKSSLDDYAILIPREKIDAEPINISFDGLDNYKNVVSFSFPKKQFSYRDRTPISLISRDNWQHISYDNISFLGGGAIGGESGGVVVAETAPKQYSAVGTIIANYDDRATFVHNLGWFQDLLQGKLPNIMNPQIPLPFFKPGQQLETPFDFTNDFENSLLTPVALRKGKQPSTKEISQKNNAEINELKKSVVILQVAGNRHASGFITEIPFSGEKKQVIVTAGHFVSDFPDWSVLVFDSNNKYLTKADVAFYHYFDIYGLFRGVQYDYALLLPREKIDAPALPLVLDRPFSDFNKFKSLSFPGRKFLHKNFKLVPHLKYFSLTSNMGIIDGILYPGSSGGVVLVKNEAGKYSAIGTTVGEYSNPLTGEDYGLIHNLNWIKRFIETGVTIPQFIIPNFPKGIVSDIFDNIRKSFRITSTMQKTEQEDASLITPVALQEKATTDPLDNVAEAELVSSNSMSVGKRAVWRLKDSQGNVIAYLKYGTEEEIERTKLFHRIITENNLAQKYPLVELEYPQIITEKVNLPSKIQNQIDIELSKVRVSMWGKNRGRIPFIMTVINTDGFTYYDASNPLKKSFIAEKLGGEGIYKDEWDQAQHLVADINKKGFIHEDFANNFYVLRNKEGKLTLSMLDFEPTPNKVPDNTFELEIIEQSLNKMGLVKKTLKSPPDPLSNVVKASLVPVTDGIVDARAVWELSDKKERTIGYLKYGNKTEIDRAKLFHEIVTENDLLENYTLFDLEYPQILSTDISSLNKDVLKNIKADFSGIKNYMRESSKRNTTYFVTTPIDASGFTVGRTIFPTKERGHSAAEKLSNKIITDEEWAQIEDFFNKLNSKGFVHEDLMNNMFFKRDTDGKLQISILDFENVVKVSTNADDIRRMENYFNELKPYFKLGVLQNVNRSELVITERGKSLAVHAVWRLYDNHGKIVGYLKYGTPEEIENTKRLHKIFTTKGLHEKFKNIGIEYPQILAEDATGIPDAVLKNIKEEFKRVKHLVRDPNTRARTMFVLSPINEEGFCWGSMRNGRESVLFAQVKINNKPITSIEWGTLVDLILELNSSGFFYDDIYNNLFFRRNANNKLIISLIDFENEIFSNSLRDLQNLGNLFNAIGLKEKSFYYDNLFGKEYMEDF